MPHHEVSQDEDHGVPRVYVVPAVDVVPVDAQAEPGDDGDDALEHLGEGEGGAELGRALVQPVRLGHRGHPHGDRPVHVEEADDEQDAAEDDPAVAVEDDDHHGGDRLRGQQDLRGVEGPTLWENHEQL